MKRLLMLFVLLSSSCLLWGQGRFEVSVNGALPTKSRTDVSLRSGFTTTLGDNARHIIPSVGFRLSPHLMLGISVHLPYSLFNKSDVTSYGLMELEKPDGFETLALEFWLRKNVFKVGRLSLDLRFLGYGGKMNVSKDVVWGYGLNRDPDNGIDHRRDVNSCGCFILEPIDVQKRIERIHKEQLEDLYPYRWQIGVSPQLSLGLWGGLSLQASYGFLGYFSHKDVGYSSRSQNKFGYLGFSDDASFSNSLRLGLSYTF